MLKGCSCSGAPVISHVHWRERLLESSDITLLSQTQIITNIQWFFNSGTGWTVAHTPYHQKQGHNVLALFNCLICLHSLFWTENHKMPKEKQLLKPSGYNKQPHIEFVSVKFRKLVVGCCWFKVFPKNCQLGLMSMKAPTIEENSSPPRPGRIGRRLRRLAPWLSI